MTITYRFSVSLTLPLTTDPEHPDFYTKEAATDVQWQRRLEKLMSKAVQGFEGGDADAELLDYEIDGEHDGICDCEDCSRDRAQSEAEELRR